MTVRHFASLPLSCMLVLAAAGCSPVQDPQVEKTREKSEQTTKEVKQEAKKDAKEVQRGTEDLGKKVGEGARKLDVETRPAREQLGVEARAAGEKLKEGAKRLGSEAVAVAQGVRAGWKEGDAQININTASRAELLRIGDLNDVSARRIIAGRPYGAKKDLVNKKAISADTYVKIEDKITTE